jgi:hypothetical protein
MDLDDPYHGKKKPMLAFSLDCPGEPKRSAPNLGQNIDESIRSNNSESINLRILNVIFCFAWLYPAR